jgi:hypothetical protein
MTNQENCLHHIIKYRKDIKLAEDYCKKHHQLLAGQTCEKCPDKVIDTNKKLQLKQTIEDFELSQHEAVPPRLSSVKFALSILTSLLKGELVEKEVVDELRNIIKGYKMPQEIAELKKQLLEEKKEKELLLDEYNNASKMLLDIVSPGETKIKTHIVDYALIVHTKYKKLKKQLAEKFMTRPEINKKLWEASKEWHNTHSENAEGYLTYLASALTNIPKEPK